jgi:geranylgeranyl diphosphate synthase type II
MTLSVQDLLHSGADRTDRALDRLLPSPDTAPHSIHRAMRHSVFAGGKRLRPILCFEAWRMTAQHSHSEQAAVDLGAALEMLHTYSLIHDDLPALDNDDLRRGQPTCHKVFGDAIAILAGDALQTLAFGTIARLDCPAITTIDILKEVTTAVGTGIGPVPAGYEFDQDLPPGVAPGMIGGQVVDLESEGKRQVGATESAQAAQSQPPTSDLVEQIHRAKTGALITVSIVTGGHIAGASHDTIHRLRTFGQNAGLAFQIVDDVLDITQASEQLGKTAGKDTATTKATWPAIFGVDRSLADARDLIADAFAALDPFGPAANLLKSLAQYLVDRKN